MLTQPMLRTVLTRAVELAERTRAVSG